MDSLLYVTLQTREAQKGKRTAHTFALGVGRLQVCISLIFSILWHIIQIIRAHVYLIGVLVPTDMKGLGVMSIYKKKVTQWRCVT